ncbi:MAG: hypothetical protein L3J88_12980 [Gammaproteobacteria bacterium]|nr:hypothetical protein [Gammaproteobacteria bacterium]MCF6364228.1 hypothetical protein [Gammaproteobacteria bacterium]
MESHKHAGDIPPPHFYSEIVQEAYEMKSHNHFYSKEFVFKLISTTLFTMALVACGGGDEPENNTGGNGPVNGGSKTELEGTWKNCFSGRASSASTAYTFSGSSFSLIKERYTDSNCSDKDITMLSVTGIFEIKSSITTDSGASAKEIDFHHLTGYEFNQQPKFYNIFLMDNDNLYWGDGLTGDTASVDQRPTDISYTLPYVSE